MDRFSSCAIDCYQQYINYLIAHFLYFSLFLSTSCCIPRLLYLRVFYLVVCFRSSFSIFHLYTLFPVLSLPRFPAALAWRRFFFFIPAHFITALTSSILIACADYNWFCSSLYFPFCLVLPGVMSTFQHPFISMSFCNVFFSHIGTKVLCTVLAPKN